MPEEMVQLTEGRSLAGDPATDLRAASWLRQKYGYFKSARAVTVERDWVRQIRAYKMLVVSRSYMGRSNLVLPHIRNMVERIVGRIVQQLVGREDFFGVMPTKWTDEDKAEVVRAVMFAQMEEEGFRRETALCIRDAVILGTAFKKMRWQYEVENTNVPVYQGDEWMVGPNGPEMKPVYSQKVMPRVIHNRPRGERLNPFNLFLDPAAQTLDDTDTVEETQLSVTDIFRLADLGIFNKDAVTRVLNQPGENGKSNLPTAGYRQIYDLALGLQGERRDRGTDYYCYKEFWGWFPLEAKDEREAARTRMERVCIGVLGTGEECVRLERNPTLQQKKPYQRGVIIEVPGQFYGDSPVKAAIPQWMELNDCRNQANDARTFAVNPVLLRGQANADDKKTSQRVFPGAIITGADLKFGAFPDTTAAAFVAESVMVRELEETFGAPRILDAQSDANSATEASIEKEESGNRILGYVKTLEDTLLVPELRDRLDLNRQYLRTSDAVRIRGASGFDWRPYTPEDFMPQYDFFCMASSQMQSKMMLNANFAITTDRMLAFEQLQPGMFDWVRWWGTFFRDGLGIDHASLYINPMKRAERVPTVEEVILMLTEGQRPDPDPRQDFASTLPTMAAYIAEKAQMMPPDLQRNFAEYFRKSIETARQILLEQQAAQMQLMMGASEGGPPGQSPQGGGKNNKQVGPEMRDGRGASPARQGMQNTRRAVQR
jgi:hypothetical protein